MQSALDVCFRAAFNMQTIFILINKYVYDTRIGFCMRYKVRECVLMYMIHKHNSFNFQIGFKIEPKRNNLKLNPFKILSFNAINKTTLLSSCSSWGGDSLRCTYPLLPWGDTGEWIFNAVPHWSLGLLNAVIASATRVQWALIKFGWAFASLFWICLFTSFIVRLNKVIKTVLDLKALDGINMP